MAREAAFVLGSLMLGGVALKMPTCPGRRGAEGARWWAAPRPDGFRKRWGYIRHNSRWVLGGTVYAWTRNGPQEIDRAMGLTDDEEPVDRRSLEALRDLFHRGTRDPHVAAHP